MLKDRKARDEQDQNRQTDPLRPAQDAVILDTTNLKFEESAKNADIVKFMNKTEMKSTGTPFYRFARCLLSIFSFLVYPCRLINPEQANLKTIHIDL